MAGEIAVGIPEAARRLGLSTWSVRAEIRAGRLRSFSSSNQPRSRRLIRVAALEAWAERREQISNQPAPTTRRRTTTAASGARGPLPFPECERVS